MVSILIAICNVSSFSQCPFDSLFFFWQSTCEKYATTFNSEAKWTFNVLSLVSRICFTNAASLLWVSARMWEQIPVAHSLWIWPNLTRRRKLAKEASARPKARVGINCRGSAQVLRVLPLLRHSKVAITVSRPKSFPLFVYLAQSSSKGCIL